MQHQTVGRFSKGREDTRNEENNTGGIIYEP